MYREWDIIKLGTYFPWFSLLCVHQLYCGCSLSKKKITATKKDDEPFLILRKILLVDVLSLYLTASLLCLIILSHIIPTIPPKLALWDSSLRLENPFMSLGFHHRKGSRVFCPRGQFAHATPHPNHNPNPPVPKLTLLLCWPEHEPRLLWQAFFILIFTVYHF